jgi:leucyl aminopeptidase
MQFHSSMLPRRNATLVPPATPLLLVATLLAASCSPTDPGGGLATGPAALEAEMVRAVRPDSLMATVEALEAFLTRFAYSASHDSARAYLIDRVRALGLPAREDTFTYLSGEFRSSANVVVRLPGGDGVRVVAGAHYDTFQARSYLEPESPAPGADDNGSSVACLVEALRVLRGYRFRHTIEVVFFSAEEIGRHGSLHYVDDLEASGDSLLVYLNLDVVGYDADSLPDADLTFNPSAQAASDSLLAAGGRWGGPFGVVYAPRPGGPGNSDHLSFWDAGLPAVWLGEGLDDVTPWLHTVEDRSGTINRTFLHANARTTVAGVARLAVPLGRRGPPPWPPPGGDQRLTPSSVTS